MTTSTSLHVETKLYNPMTVEELQKKYQSIPWLKYLNTILPEKVLESVMIKLSLSVCHHIWKNSKNYVMWRSAKGSVSRLNEAARKLALDYTSVLQGSGEPEPRWKECVGVVNNW